MNLHHGKSYCPVEEKRSQFSTKNLEERGSSFIHPLSIEKRVVQHPIYSNGVARDMHARLPKPTPILIGPLPVPLPLKLPATPSSICIHKTLKWCIWSFSLFIVIETIRIENDVFSTSESMLELATFVTAA